MTFFERALSAVVAAATLATGCSSDESSSNSTKPSPLVSAPDVCATALACESFDAFPIGTTPSGVWSATQNLGSVRVDATRAYSGTQSVKATTPTTEVAYKAALLGYRDPSVLPTSNNAHFGRMMFFRQQSPPGSRLCMQAIHRGRPLT